MYAFKRYTGSTQGSGPKPARRVDLAGMLGASRTWFTPTMEYRSEQSKDPRSAGPQPRQHRAKLLKVRVRFPAPAPVKSLLRPWEPAYDAARICRAVAPT